RRRPPAGLDGRPPEPAADRRGAADRGADAVPPAREAAGAPERTRAPPADDDGRMRPLARLRLEADAVEGGEPAGETRHLLGPEHADRLQVLVGDRAALLEGNAERPELRLDIAAGEARDQASTGDQVERCERLGEKDRVVVRHDED